VAGSRFRHERRSATGPSALSRTQIVALLTGLAVVIGLVAVAAVLVKPNRSRAFALVRGSIFLADARAPVAVDLATGKPTVRLINARTQVSADNENNVAVVALNDTTLLLNRETGAFNMVDSTGFVIKTTPGGIALPAAPGSATATATATAIADGDRAYVLRSSSTTTAVYLVAKTTVEAAVNSSTAVKPRAFAAVNAASPLTAGSAVSADGALWLLTGTGTAQTLHELSLPTGAPTGATLDAADRGTVAGPGALATAITATGATAVGLATPTKISVFAADGTARTLAAPQISDVDQILPVTNDDSRLAWMVHGKSGGWHLLGVDANAPDRVRDIALGKIPATASLATPVASGGSVYTMDTSTDGTLWQIGSGGTVTNPAGTARYPTSTTAAGKSVEVRDFADAQVVARDGRVIFNSPDHLLAITLFTDGSHPAAVIDKSAAVDLNSIGGATALTKSRTDRPKTSTKPAPQPKAPVPPQQPINNKATCATTTQTPHIPTVTQATPASRSVLLTWAYPIVDNQDCVPSTYLIKVKLLDSTGRAPSPPGQVSVQGQQGANLTGLYPSTRYQITVTAFINGRGTESSPIQVTTGREGPKAPTGVHTTVDATGTWTISWSACGDPRTGCVPAATWTVVPSFCDGVGLSAAPTPLTVTGDSSLTHFTATFGGNPNLLGRGMTFSVQGVGDLGDAGIAAGDGTCTRSWAPPAASQITLTASSPAVTALGQPASTTLTLHLGGNPTATAGGVGATFRFELLSGSTVIASQGPTTNTSATFNQIAAGKNYTARAVVTPPGHPEAAVTVTADAISTRANWPALTVSSAKVARNADLVSGTLTVHIDGISSAAAGGETFDLINSVLTCGSTSMPLTATNFDPSTRDVTATVDLRQYYGSCTVTVQLSENSATQSQPPVFGGTPSPALAGVAVDLPNSASGPFSPTTFHAEWNDTPDAADRSVVTVSGTDVRFALVQSWNYVLSDGNTASCNGADVTGAPTQTIESKQKCVDNSGDDAHLTAWSVQITYRFFGSAPQTVTVPVAGKPPTYHAPAPPTSSPPSSDPPSTAPPGSPSAPPSSR
jgi:hypothetical protein